MVSLHQWQEATLCARDANDALADAILEHYAVPGKPSTAEMPLSAAGASRTLTNVTLALISIADETNCHGQYGKAAEAARLAMANDAALLSRADQITAAACPHNSPAR